MSDIEKLLQDAGKTAKNIAMTAAEKNQRRDALMSFMMKAENLPAQPLQKVGKARNWLSWVYKMSPAYLAAPLIIVVGTGIVYAAEISLPGDFLYPLKTNVVEKFQRAVAFSHEQQATLDADFAMKRLQEAETIAKRNALDDQKRKAIAMDFNKISQQLTYDIQALRTDHKDDIADQIMADFALFLRDHDSILKSLQLELNNQTPEIPAPPRQEEQTGTQQSTEQTGVTEQNNPPVTVPGRKPPAQNNTELPIVRTPVTSEARPSI